MASEIESEAVRMPIDLPPLDFKPKPLQQESNWQLRSECRERQLLAALTELQTERAAHERTRAELHDHNQHIKYAYAALGDVNPNIYLFDHIAKLRSELTALKGTHAD